MQVRKRPAEDVNWKHAVLNIADRITFFSTWHKIQEFQQKIRA